MNVSSKITVLAVVGVPCIPELCSFDVEKYLYHFSTVTQLGRRDIKD